MAIPTDRIYQTRLDLSDPRDRGLIIGLLRGRIRRIREFLASSASRTTPTVRKAWEEDLERCQMILQALPSD